MITGIDISEKNGSFNLRDINKGDVNFVYIKASEALNSSDRCYLQNVDSALANDLLFGAYHWLHPRLHVGQQAEFFVERVGNFSGMLPPAVCLEMHRAPVEKIGRNIKTFLEILKKLIGVKPIIYTSKEYWKQYLSKEEWACEYPLWIDHPGGNWPPQIFPWAGWSFWQYSYQANLPGIPADIGLNWFNGNLNELESMVIQ